MTVILHRYDAKWSSFLVTKAGGREERQERFRPFFVREFCHPCMYPKSGVAIDWVVSGIQTSARIYNYVYIDSIMCMLQNIRVYFSFFSCFIIFIHGGILDKLLLRTCVVCVWTSHLSPECYFQRA